MRHLRAAALKQGEARLIIIAETAQKNFKGER